MIATNPILGNVYINQIQSEKNLLVWQHRIPSLGEPLGESFLEAIVTLEGEGILEEYFNRNSLHENGKIIKKEKVCGIGNLKVRKYYGDTIMEIGENNIDIFDNYGEAPQIKDIFDVSIIYYDSDGDAFFWLDESESKSMSLIGVIKPEEGDLTQVGDTLSAMFDHLIVPIFLKLMLMNHDCGFTLKMDSKSPNQNKIIVEISMELNALKSKFEELKKLPSRN